MTVVLVAGLVAAACGRYSLSNIRAVKAFKDGNTLYQRGEFRGAIDKYEAALKLNSEYLGITYFFLGNSYENLYKPSKKGEPENDAYLLKAVENYKLATQKIKDTDQEGPLIRKRSYEYLISAYGPDKLNDFSQAEPIALQMIGMEPNEPFNYQALGRLYEDQGRYEEAEAQFKKAVDLRPNDALGYQLLGGFYNRQGEFEKTMDAFYARANAEPKNPEAWHTIGTYYSTKALQDKRLTKKVALDYVMKGLAAEDKALALNEGYFEAYIFKNILLLQQANLETDPAKRAQLTKEAEAYRTKGLEIQKKQNASVAEDAKKGGR
jgi:tetratricopeptide (TPR) repeat protein